MTTTGVVGGRWRATISNWGAVEPWDGSPVLDWFVAADDRWHRPEHEASTRQTRLDGTPVVETRVHIPGGDAVQRVYSVADAGGLTVVDVTNDSSLPIAVAFTGGGLSSRRPATTVPIQGIELAADAVIHPIGHRSTLVVARAHSAEVTALPESLPSAEQVSHGWLAQTQRASRLHLPDATMVERLTAARCELLLSGPDPDGDSSAFILAVAEMVRMGHPPTIWVPEIAAHLERLARTGAQTAPGVVQAAARVLHAAGEDRAVADLRRMNLVESTDDPGPDGVERLLVASDEHEARLMPKSFPGTWLGVDFEAHGLPIGLASTLSFAIRWHGARPAVLWEVSGQPMPLTYRSWSTGQLSGEALWDPVDD